MYVWIVLEEQHRLHKKRIGDMKRIYPKFGSNYPLFYFISFEGGRHWELDKLPSASKTSPFQGTTSIDYLVIVINTRLNFHFHQCSVWSQENYCQSTMSVKEFKDIDWNVPFPEEEILSTVRFYNHIYSFEAMKTSYHTP